METRRQYTQRARAASAARTRERILDATVELARQQASVEIVLNDVAERAGVSVQTVLRHFGSRDGLFEEAMVHAARQVAAERAAPVGDIPAAIGVLFDHYERWGTAMLRLLAEETIDPRAGAVTRHGREMHREWVHQVFAEHLDACPPAHQDEVTDLLVVATDLYTWKLLVRDRGLSRVDAEARVHHLLAAVLGGHR